jgi:hypothetical protein
VTRWIGIYLTCLYLHRTLPKGIIRQKGKSHMHWTKLTLAYFDNCSKDNLTLIRMCLMFQLWQAKQRSGKAKMEETTNVFPIHTFYLFANLKRILYQTMEEDTRVLTTVLEISNCRARKTGWFLNNICLEFLIHNL